MLADSDYISRVVLDELTQFKAGFFHLAVLTDTGTQPTASSTE